MFLHGTAGPPFPLPTRHECDTAVSCCASKPARSHLCLRVAVRSARDWPSPSRRRIVSCRMRTRAAALENEANHHLA